MIPIKKEPKELYEEFKTYEKCKFCRKETDTWHEKTNTPVCKVCAKSHKVNDLQLLAITDECMSSSLAQTKINEQDFKLITEQQLKG